MDAQRKPWIIWWGGLLAGIATHLLFAVTVWYLFWFLRDGSAKEADRPLLWDACLALQFTIPHSLLLLPSVRSRLSRWIPREFYGLFYCVTTSLSLFVLFWGWRASDVVLYRLNGTFETLVRGAFYASWAALFYSLHLTGLGWQTGLTPWLCWVRNVPVPRREFVPRGAYRWIRHPVYLSFLGLIWFTPTMTLDHVVLTGIWSIYILVGSHLKDGRLLFFYGDTYREYWQRVPGFVPLWPRFGRIASAAPVEHFGAHAGPRATTRSAERIAA